MQHKIRHTLPIAIVAGAIALVSADAQNPRSAGDPKGWFSTPPDQIAWTKGNDGSGRETAYLVGDRNKPGLYIQLVKWPPHATAMAHSHPDDRYVVVLSGTFYHGHGNKFDAGKLEKRSTRTFFTEPGGVAHFGATKDEGCILYFVGTGPSRTDQIEK